MTSKPDNRAPGGENQERSDDQNEPLALAIAGTDKIVAHACGKCRLVARSEADARACCAPRLCSCGLVIERHRTKCATCSRDESGARELDRINKAPKVSWRDHGDPVYLDGSPGGNDGYHEDIDQFVEAWMDDHDALPSFVWACEVQRLSIDATEVVQRELEAQEFYEDAFDHVEQRDIDRLQKALDRFEKSADLKSWVPNGSIVLLDGYPVAPRQESEGPNAAA